jgi:hypothetical protein
LLANSPFAENLAALGRQWRPKGKPMTWSSIKDVVAVLAALVGVISAVATGVAKIHSWWKGAKAPTPEPAAPPPSPAWRPDLSEEPSLVSRARPQVQTIPVAPSFAREQARAAVRAPAFAMLALAGVGLLFNLCLACFGFVDNFVTPLSSSSLLSASAADPKVASDGRNATSEQANAVLAIVLFLSMATATVAALFGGLSMLKLQNRLVAMAGSIAIMPGTCFCCLLGFPMGVWSLLVLMRPEVKAAFHS